MPAPRGQTKQKSTRKVESINWPADGKGQPMAQISFTASELIPTQQYANVTIGPVTITMFVPLDNPTAEIEAHKESLIAACNAMAEVVETSVSEQRELVYENLKSQAEADSSK